MSYLRKGMPKKPGIPFLSFCAANQAEENERRLLALLILNELR